MITSLQIILAAVGVLFIAAVIGYNLWQERKYRQEASRLFSTKREDILLGESVSTENHEGYSILSESGHEEGAGLHMREAEHEALLEKPLEPVEPPYFPGIRPDERRPESDKGVSIQLEGLIRESEDEDLVVPTHARTVPPPTVKAPPPEPLVSAPEAHESRLQEVKAAEPPRFHPESGLDEAIEYIARLRFAQPAMTAYVGLLEGLRRIGKPVRAMGKRPGQGWEPLSAHPATAYEALEFGIQIADRNGALTAAQLDRFCQLLYDFAAAEGGAVSCPDKQAALQKARDLDAFCMDVDVLIGLTVMAREDQPFRGEDLHELATQAGLTLQRDGAYYLMDEQGHAQFSLANQEEQPFREGGVGLTTHGVTLLFDIPRVADGLAVFDRMTSLGLRLAETLGGKLVDDNGRMVNQDNLQKDRRRLADYYARMRLRGIEAGSERALRLFS